MSSFIVGIREHPCTMAYYASFVSYGLALAILGPTLEYLAKQFDTSIANVTFLFPSRSFGYFCGSAAGTLFDRFPGHILLSVVLLLAAAANAALPFCEQLWIPIVLGFIQGVSMGFLDTGGNVLLILLHRERKVAPFMQALHFAFGLGAFVCPLIVERLKFYLGTSNGVKWSFWALSLFIVPIALWLACTKSPSLKKSESHEKTVRHRKDWIVGLLTGLVLCLDVGIEVSVGGFVHTYAARFLSFTEDSADFLNSMFWGFLALGRLAAIGASFIIPTRFIMLACTIMCAVSLGVLCVTQSSLVLWIGVGVFGFFNGPIFPGAINLTEEYVDVTGSFATLFVTGAALGEMVIPIILGRIFKDGDDSLIWLMRVADVVAVLGVFACVLLMVVGSTTVKSKNKKHGKQTSVELTDIDSEKDEISLVKAMDSDY